MPGFLPSNRTVNFYPAPMISSKTLWGVISYLWNPFLMGNNDTGEQKECHQKDLCNSRSAFGKVERTRDEELKPVFSPNFSS